MSEAIILSDIHLGSINSQTQQLSQFLNEIRTEKLILNGDIFDSINFKRMNKRHLVVLEKIRYLSHRTEVIWLGGNHDGSDALSAMLGVPVLDEYVLESGGKKILCMHGHQFDSFIYRFPRTTALADCMYNLLQMVDPSHEVARFAKLNCKRYLKCRQIIKESAIEHASGRYDAVCCGHTHSAASEEFYHNSGCWTERAACTYLEVKKGLVSLRHFDA